MNLPDDCKAHIVDAKTITRTMHTAEIIAAGTELTSGQKLDTNSQWLAGQLRDRGIDVRFHTTVGDAIEDNIAAIHVARERCDIVLMTGGLGPTQDDITREAVAKVMDETLVIDSAALADLETFFGSRGRTMPDRNRTQAMRPFSAEMLKNPHGTAPGVYAELKRSNVGESNRSDTALFAAMPGVPSEMRPMFLHQVAPRFPASNVVQSLRLVHCYGIGESAAEERLGDLTARGRNPEVGITASAATITLRILARGPSVTQCDSLAAADEEEITRLLDGCVFGRGEDTLQSVVVDHLAAAGATIAIADSGTGGAIASLLTETSGYERVFRGGLTTPGGLDDELLGERPPEDPFSTARAKALALEIRQRLNADYGVAAVCAPGQLTANPTPKDAIAYIAVASSNDVIGDEIRLLGNAAIHRIRVAKSSLNLLFRKHLTRSSKAI